mgnify:CR=1 FL=1
MSLPAKEIIEILKPAYEPCKSIEICSQANWHPEKGHIPRGYLGATGEISEVEVVFVLAEPSHPLETYSKKADPLTYIKNCTDLAYECYLHNTYQGKPLEINIGHQNLKIILNMLWPDLSFDQQLRKVWITESRLCSIDDKTGNIPLNQRYICSENYLKRQLKLLSHAEIVGFGGKAKKMLDKLDIEYHSAWAPFPPGANNPKAMESWKRAVRDIMENRNSDY